MSKVTDFLKENEIPFEEFRCSYTGQTTLSTISEELQAPLSVICKTLVLTNETKDKFVIAIIPGDKKINFEKISLSFFGFKSKAKLCPRKLAEEISGYEAYGTSPLKTEMKMRVVLDESLLPELSSSSKDIYINGGERGLVLKISIKNLFEAIMEDTSLCPLTYDF